MPLILRVRSYKNELPATPLQHGFGPEGGFIGRSPDNDLCLPDANKLISRRHARIEYRSGRFFWIDSGSNPSQLNGQALITEQPTALAAGDRLLLGDYLLEVSEEAEDSLFTASTTQGLLPSDALQDWLTTPESSPSAQNDPLGIALLHSATAEQKPPATESDHISPEHQAIPSAGIFSSLAIPADYDPLQDLHQTAAQSSGLPSVQNSAPLVANTSPSASNPEAVTQALLRGLGLSAADVSLPAPVLAELTGQLLQQLVAGLMATLKARTIIKRESRLDLTLMAAQANNPLKFMPDAPAALRQMLTQSLPGYMPAQQAIEAACDDLQGHELAVMSGMQASLQALLQHFDPARLEQQASASGLNPKARLWEHFTEVHAQLHQDVHEDFQALFGEPFANAYEEQMDKLRRTLSRRS